MLYQNTSVRITSTTKKAMAPEGKNFSFSWGDSMFEDFSFRTNLPARQGSKHDLNQLIIWVLSEAISRYRSGIWGLWIGPIKIFKAGIIIKKKPARINIPLYANKLKRGWHSSMNVLNVLLLIFPEIFTRPLPKRDDQNKTREIFVTNIPVAIHFLLLKTETDFSIFNI